MARCEHRKNPLSVLTVSDSPDIRKPLTLRRSLGLPGWCLVGIWRRRLAISPCMSRRATTYFGSRLNSELAYSGLWFSRTINQLPSRSQISILTSAFSRMEISSSIRASIKRREGVTDVIMARSCPDTACRLWLSFISLSSKICGLTHQLSPDTTDDVTCRKGMMYGKAATARTSENSIVSQTITTD